ncbi:hypothetical protein N330_08360, partial [Leptosomus discolor]
RAASETLQGQLEELERAAARLQELCPARLCPGHREGLRRGWLVLSRLSHAHSSWTEDTRAQIFSESPSGHSLPETPCEELERRIEGKLKEFEALA